ncbi:MAG: hypothetical protein AAFX06_26225 [Planctomycetota bacterium]
MTARTRDLPTQLARIPQVLLAAVLFTFLTGCPAPTPGERLEQLNAKITNLGDGNYDVDLSGTKLSDADFPYIHGFSNNRGQVGVRVLDLSNTDVTDKTLDAMIMQTLFCPPKGIQVLVLENTGVTLDGIKRYQERYPEVEVRW